MDSESSGRVPEVSFFDSVDEIAVVALSEHPRDLVFEVEAFSEN
jgi:hypothetical protein